MEEDEGPFSAVLFDIEYDRGPNAVSLAKALEKVFAFTPAIQLRESRTSYQAGDYRRRHRSRTWAGRLQLQKTSSAYRTKFDEATGYRFEEAETVTTPEADTFFAIDPDRRLIVYRERAALPHTRLASYVRRAVKHHWSDGFRIELQPRESEKRVKEWIDFFDSVFKVSVQYRHSHSPGNRAVDKLLEELEAESARQQFVAETGGSLDKERLKELEAIDHVDRHDGNGSVQFDGDVDDERLRINTANPVERVRLSASRLPNAIRSALAAFLENLTED